MRVLFVTFPWRTHLQPIVPLAWAIQAARHEVRVASGPELSEVTIRAGLTAVPAGSGEPVFAKVERAQTAMLERITEERGRVDDLVHDMAENRVEELTWERLRWLYRFVTDSYKAMNDAMVEDLVDHCRWWRPDLVIWDSLSYAGPVVAAAVGAAHARMPAEIDVGLRMRRHFLRVRAQQPPEHREDPLGEWLGGWAEKYGASFTEEMVTGQFTIEQMLGSLRVESPVPHVGFRYLAYNGPSVVPDWLRRDPAERRVLASFGLSLQTDPGASAFSPAQLRAVLDSLADLDIELVVTVPEKVRQEIGAVPGNTRPVEFVPLHVIIPSCAVVIHHGGVPAFMNSVAEGVPQLMVSRIVPDIGERGPRTVRAGAGLWIPGDDPAELSGPRIREHVGRLLEDPAFRAGAARWRDEWLAQPTPAEAVREIALLTQRYRTR